jgi:competence protein ComEC
MDFRNAANGMIGRLLGLWLAALALVAGVPTGLDAQDAATGLGGRHDPAGVGAQDDPVRVTFLDVGQGDAVLVQAPEGQAALIDAGPGVELASRLRGLGVDTLDLVIASHPHADHIGGMREILRAFPVRFYMDNGQPHTTTTYATVMQELRDRTEIVYLQATPRTIEMGSAQLRVLPPPPDADSNLNNASVGVILEHGDFVGFFSGDSERPELMHFLQEGAVPDVTLLKAPHHGSDDAVSERFLDAADPEVVVISVGRGNRYGHPKPAALRSYASYADHLLRTDVNGRVTVLGYPDGTYEIETGGSVTAPEETSETVEVAIEVVADAPGNDHQNRNGEYAIIRNAGESPLAIGGWVLCDRARHCYTFPVDARIASGGSVFLFTGTGRDADGRLYWGSGSAIWNNRGDTATLYDARGRIVATHVY